MRTAAWSARICGIVLPAPRSPPRLRGWPRTCRGSPRRGRMRGSWPTCSPGPGRADGGGPRRRAGCGKPGSDSSCVPASPGRRAARRRWSRGWPSGRRGRRCGRRRWERRLSCRRPGRTRGKWASAPRPPSTAPSRRRATGSRGWRPRARAGRPVGYPPSRRGRGGPPERRPIWNGTGGSSCRPSSTAISSAASTPCVPSAWTPVRCWASCSPRPARDRARYRSNPKQE